MLEKESPRVGARIKRSRTLLNVFVWSKHVQVMAGQSPSPYQIVWSKQLVEAWPVAVPASRETTMVDFC